MDFDLTDEQFALIDHTRGFLERRCDDRRFAALEADGTWFDQDLWRDLAHAGLVGIALPEPYGGGGAGFFEAAIVLEQVGAFAPPLPYWETVILGALPIAQFGTPEQQKRDLPDVATGAALLTAALVEPGATDPRKPRTTAHPDLNRWVLDGAKTCVPVAPLARRIVVPATTDDGAALFLVDPSSNGAQLRAEVATNGQPQAELQLDSAPAELLATGAQSVTWLLDRALAGLAAWQAGIAGAALRMAAEYTTGREQFGRPVGSFQAVAHRLADSYLDAEGIRLTAVEAAWRIAEGLPAAEAVAVAKWWAAEGGHRVVHAAQHVHGGVGVDTEYPLHRYTRTAKLIEMTLGGASHQLNELGVLLAAK